MRDLASKDIDAAVAILSSVPEIDGEHIRRQLSKHDKDLVLIARGVAWDLAKSIEQRFEDVGLYWAVVLRTDSRRVYPFSQIGSSIVGGVGVDQQGLSGIEAEYDRELGGRPHDRLVLTDVTGVPVKGEPESRESQRGTDVHLFLDIRLQEEADEALALLGAEQLILNGAIATIEAETGHVLAAGAFPSYDFNRRSGIVSHFSWSPVLRNRYDTPMVSFLALGAAAILDGGTSFQQLADLLASTKTLGRHRPEDWNVGGDDIATAIRRHRITRSLGIFDSHGVVEIDAMHTGDLRFAMTPIQLARLVAEFVNGGKAVTPSLTALHAEGRESVGATVVPQGVAEGFVSLLETNLRNRWADFAEIPGYRVGGVESATALRNQVSVVFVGFTRNEVSSDPLVTVVALGWLGRLEDGERQAVQIFRSVSAAANWKREGWVASKG